MYQTAFVPFQSLFFDYCESSQKHNMHVLQYHDTYEVYLQTSGERYLFLNDICHMLRPGDIYLLKPFEMHYTQSRTSEYYGRYVINFSEKQLELLLTPLERELLFDKLESGIVHLESGQYERIVTILQGLDSCYGKSGFLSEKLQYTYILQLLLLLKTCMADNHQFSSAGCSCEVRPEIMNAVNYINRNYQEQLTLDDVAGKVHMSKYYFCRLFHQATGATFLEYLNNVRLAKAHQMLTQTGLSLSEIAARTGFSSSVHLSRVFRASYKQPPNEFRKRTGDPA